MSKSKLLEIIANKIFLLQKNKPIIVAINGIDGAGKTCFTKELRKVLDSKSGNVIYASVDNFHNPKQLRYTKGKNSAVGFYKDSYNYAKLLELLINPILNTEKYCKLKYYDAEKEEKVLSDLTVISNKTILILEGIFLFRPELVHLWDYKIYLDISFETALERNIIRANNESDVFVNRYLKRYKAGQELYLKESNPQIIADMIIDNNDFEEPFEL